MLRRKLRREFRKQKGQAIAVTLLVAVGVALFVASYAGYLDLSSSYAASQDRLALADLHVEAAAIRPSHVAEAAAVPGVARAESRLVVSLPISVSSRREAGGRPAEWRLEGRFLSLPDTGEPALDLLHFVAGGPLPGAGEVVLEKHLADYHRLKPGDEVRVEIGAAGTPLRVAGVAVAAEYLWVAKNRQEIMVSPADFGVLWVRRGVLGRLLEAARAGWDVVGATAAGAPLPGIAATMELGPDDGNQLLVDLASGADAGAVTAALHGILGPLWVDATPRDKLVGAELLQLDLDGFRGMAYFFPVFFLVVAAFVSAALLGRMVDSQRRLIGTMLALGASRRMVLHHYLAFSLVLGVVGSLLGALGGIAAGHGMVVEYAAELNIPFVLTSAHPWITALGILFGVGVTALAGWLPARRAASLAPAEAMRRAPTSGRSAGLRKLRLPLPLRSAVRSLLRRPGRSLATAFGVAAALVVVLVTALLVDSMEQAVDVALKSSTYDLRADLLVPRAEGDLLDTAGRLPGVLEAEVSLTLPVQLTGPGGSYRTMLQGVPETPRLSFPVDFDGNAVLPRAGEVILPREVAERLSLGVGDEVSIRPLPIGPAIQARVGGLSDAIAGAVAHARLADMRARLGWKDAANTLMVRTRPGSHGAARDELRRLPSLASFMDLETLRELIEGFMGLALVFVGVMLLLAVILAAAVLFNTATLGILERRRELATQRALGQSMRGIALMLTLEHALLGLLGLIAGLPLGLLAARWTISFYSSDLMSLPFAVSARTIGVAVLGVLLVLLLAQWPALHAVSRMNIAEAVRGDDD